MNRNDENQDLKLERIFKSVREVEMEASPFLAARVVARLREERRAGRQLMIWKVISGAALTLAAVAVVWNVRMNAPQTDKSALVAQAYVIHVDFDETEVAAVDHVEVELPEGVRFYSKTRAAELANVRKLKLPISRAFAGRNKLPFVVQSSVAGERQFTVRLFDEANHLMRERLLTVNFSGTGRTVSL
jgi:hypothetical protein